MPTMTRKSNGANKAVIASKRLSIQEHYSLNYVSNKKSSWIPRANVELLLQVAAGTGANINEILREMGIFSSDVKSIASSLMGVPKSKYAALLRRCMAILNAYVYRQANYNVPIFDDDLFYSCIMSGRTLEEVIQKAGKFYRSVNGPLGNVSLDDAGKDSVFILHASLKEQNIYVFTFYLFMLSCFYKFFSWLIGESLCPTKISIAHPRIVENDVISEILDCHVEFDAAHNAIFFNKKLLLRPIVRTNRELDEIIKVSLFEFMPVPAVASISVYLEKLIKKMLRENVRIPGVDAIASQLGRSGQTLRRHLAQEKVSFQYILDKCRLERAQELLSSSNMTIDEISAGMGFSAPSGFSRAFKSWTGYAPSLYRQLSAVEQAQANVCTESVRSDDFAVDDESYT